MGHGDTSFKISMENDERIKDVLDIRALFYRMGLPMVILQLTVLQTEGWTMGTKDLLAYKVLNAISQNIAQSRNCLLPYL